MRRVVLACWVLVVLTSTSTALTTDEGRTRLHAEQIRSFYPRLEGSSGEAQLIEYLRISLARAGIEISVLDFSSSDSGHSFSRVLEASVPGTGDGTLIIVVPLNHETHRTPDKDGSASLAAALSLAEAAGGSSPAQTLRVVFVGADRESGEYAGIGSRRYLSDYFPDGAHALLYLDASGNTTRLLTGADGIVSPWWLTQRTRSAAEAARLGMDVEGSMNQVHRLGISRTPTPLGLFLSAGIPSVYVDSGERGLLAPNTGESAITIARFLESWIEAFDGGVPKQWDRHYLQFQLGEGLMVVQEPFFVTILVSVLLFTLLYALVFRRRFRRYLSTIGRNLWNLPLLFLLIFLFLSAGTYAIDLFLLVRGFPQMWIYYPAAYVGLKALLALFLFTLTSQFLRHLPFSKNGSFYSAAALFMLFLDIVIFSVINISFGHYFIWAYLAAFLFSVVPNRALKVVCMLLAPALLLQAALAVLSIPDSGLTRLLLSSVGDLLLSFVALPFLLMLMRLDFLFRHPVKGKRSFTLRFSSIAFGVGAAGILTFVLFSTPFSSSTPQPVLAVETVDYPELVRRLQLTSPAPLGTLNVSFAGESLAVDTGSNNWETDSATLPDVLSVRLSYTQFIDRERAELIIDAPQPLQTLSVRLFSEQPLVLYDASFPFTISADQRTAEIHIGDRPPLPLTIDYTVGGVLVPGVEVRASSAIHPQPITVSGRPVDLSTRLDIITRFDQ